MDKLTKLVVKSRYASTLYDRLHVYPPNGILLYGPSGVGKSALVSMLVERSRRSLIHLDAAKVRHAIVGESEKAIVRAFHRARESSPSILFIDNVCTRFFPCAKRWQIDILLPKRNQQRHHGGHSRLTTCFLTGTFISLIT